MSGTKEAPEDKMGGEGNTLCMQCGFWADSCTTCARCRLHTCEDCWQRLEKREKLMSKRLDLEWSKIDLCCMCLDILYIKALNDNKTNRA